MGGDDPPEVARHPDQRRVVDNWEIPMRVGSEDVTARGQLIYVPPPSPWPWVVGAVLLAALVVVLSRTGAWRAMFVVAGIGINVHHRPEDFPPAIQSTAGSLEEEASARVDRDRLAAELFGPLEEILGRDAAGRMVASRGNDAPCLSCPRCGGRRRRRASRYDDRPGR